MEGIEIVTLEPNKWQLYKALRLRALKEEPQAYASTYEEHIKSPDTFWQQRLQDARIGESQWLVFAKQNEKLVGMVGGFVADEKDIAHVIGVYVAKEFRGQGISKLLMTDLIDRIKQNKSIKKLLLDVNPEQVAAFSLYQSLGFVITKKEKMVLGDGLEHDNYQMEKIIE